MNFSGKDDFGFGFGGTGKKSYASQFDDYGEVSKGLTLVLPSVHHLFSWLQHFGKNDTIGCYIDTDHYTISFSKNGN